MAAREELLKGEKLIYAARLSDRNGEEKAAAVETPL